MTRSIWKGPYIHPSLLKHVERAISENSKKPIKTWSRASMILPQMVDFTFHVHNGNKFIPVVVNEYMVGHKLGEFAPTRTFKGHSGNRKENVKPGAK